MLFLKNKSTAKKSHRIIPGVLLLAVLYFLGSIEIQSLHGLVHEQDEAELHSAANEENGCHQSVYHNKKADKSCEHKSHIVALKKCPLCQLILQPLHLAAEKNSIEFPQCSDDANGHCEQSFLAIASSLNSSRAPPLQLI